MATPRGIPGEEAQATGPDQIPDSSGHNDNEVRVASSACCSVSVRARGEGATPNIQYSLRAGVERRGTSVRPWMGASFGYRVCGYMRVQIV
jgi:hypothetical protein